MAFLNYFDHGDRKKQMSHLKDLVKIALADGIIQDEERQFLEKVASNAGIGNHELNEIIDKVRHIDFIPPLEVYHKFEQLYNIARMILADEIIHEQELGYFIGYGHALDFDEELTKKLLEELQSNPKADAEELFEKLVK